MRMKIILNWVGVVAAACFTGGLTAGAQTTTGDGGADETSAFEGRSIISVLQVGEGNVANISQINPDSEAYANFGQIQQRGTTNTATINQEAVASGLAGTSNISLVAQDGFGNLASINQTGADNFAEIDQRGNENIGDILQEGVGLNAVIEQNGDGLDYAINQTGCAISGGCPPIIVRQSSAAAVTGQTSSTITVTTTGGGS